MATKTKRPRKKTKAGFYPFRATITVSQSELASACRFLLPAIDPAGTRYRLDCVCLTFDKKGRPVLSATDGRRAHVATLSAPAKIIGHASPFEYDGSSHTACIIPREIIRELADMPQANKYPQTGQMVLRVNNGGLSFTFYKSKRTHARAMRWGKGRFPRVADTMGRSLKPAGTITGPAHDMREWLNPEPRIRFEVDGDKCSARHDFPAPSRQIKSKGSITDYFDAALVRDALAEMAGEVTIAADAAQYAHHITGLGQGGGYDINTRKPTRLEFHAVIMPLHRDR